MHIVKKLKMNYEGNYFFLKTFCAFLKFLVMQLSYHVLDN
jgi:hypothetical protein